jgi:hypothetical protein
MFEENVKRLIIAVFCLLPLLSGCKSPLPDVDTSTVTSIVISHPVEGSFTVTDKADIVRLITAMQNAKRDFTAYDTAKATTIVINRTGNPAIRIQSGGSLFDVDGQQYYSSQAGDAQRELERQGSGRK